MKTHTKTSQITIVKVQTDHFNISASTKTDQSHK